MMDCTMTDRTMTDCAKMDFMTTRRVLLTHGAVGLVAAAAWIRSAAPARAAVTFEVVHTDAEWHKLLTPDQFAVLRKSATERPFTSALWRRAETPRANLHGPSAISCCSVTRAAYTAGDRPRPRAARL